MKTSKTPKHTDCASSYETSFERNKPSLREDRRLLARIHGRRRRELFRLDHPTAAQRLIDVDEREMKLGLRLGDLDLGLEETALRVEYLDVAGVAVVVAQAGKLRVAAERLHLP